MKLGFRSTGPEEEPKIKRFLAEVFALKEGALLLNGAHLLWKYHGVRDDWQGSRSYVLEQGERLNAHACAWPFTLLVNNEAVAGLHPIDWAAGTEIPGAGALLLREMRRLAPVLCCIGGTEVAQKVIASSGFRPRGEMRYYARPLRPWKQAITHPRRNWKLPGRLARNLVWSARAGVGKPGGWSAERIAPDELPWDLLPSSGADFVVARRSLALSRYLSACPVASFRLYLVRQAGSPAGYFLLSYVPGQARVADAWTIRNNEADWEALYRLAAHIAYVEGAAEIEAASALATAQHALEHAQFRVHKTLPIMIMDPKGRLEGAPPLHLQMIDNDFSFLHQGRPDYRT